MLFVNVFTDEDAQQEQAQEDVDIDGGTKGEHVERLVAVEIQTCCVLVVVGIYTCCVHVVVGLVNIVDLKSFKKRHPLVFSFSD